MRVGDAEFRQLADETAAKFVEKSGARVHWKLFDHDNLFGVLFRWPSGWRHAVRVPVLGMAPRDLVSFGFGEAWAGVQRRRDEQRGLDDE